jgi:DNA-binding PadR family transcriptional regulator
MRRFDRVHTDDVSEALVLAALERAQRHDERRRSGVVYSVLVQHLGLQMGSATGRRLRPRLRELEASGLVAPIKRHGIVLYELTPRGKRRLKAEGAVVLPESPQHRAWRVARNAAEERIGEFQEDIRRLLGEGGRLLAGDAIASEDWFVLGELLEKACSRVGSATHCLREWAEPSDDGPDADSGPRRGRRNILVWTK